MAIISTLLPPLETLPLYAALAFVVFVAINILNQLFGPKNPKEPPVVFSWVPFLGNAVEFGMNPINFLKECQKKYGDVFTFYMVGRRVTVFLGAEGNQFVFNAKQNLASAAEAYNHMTKYVFGPEVVYDAPHNVFMEQKRFIKAGLHSEAFRQHVPMIVEEVENFFKDFKKPTGLFDAYHTLGKLGQHTSATTSAWTLLELAARPDLIRALREEQITKLGSLKADLTFDNLKELTLLDSCVRETLRLHPPIYQMMRRVVSDKVVYEKTGHEIPKGNFLCAAPGVTQIDEQYFNEPLKYDPMRWVNLTDPVHKMEVGDDSNIDYGFGAVGISSKNPFLPFGAGRHRCIGEQFGYLQIKAILATMIRMFDIELEEGKGVPKPDYTSMVIVPERPSNIKYTWRE
ncbi:Putative Lanosterol 14-alpha demethylase [Rhizopus microsporus]|nr:Putative Lanosterol 14-alpha demethylase [Rhizopus microsporus]